MLEAQQQSSSVSSSSSTTTTTTTTTSTTSRTVVQKIQSIAKEHEFLLLIISAILLAKINPQFGILYLYPQITATWIAVIIIFILSGLGLQTSELHTAAFTNIQFNIFIQCYSFFFVSGLVYSVCHYILYPYHIIHNTNLCDGMIICSCLPMAIIPVMVITKCSHGCDAAAVFNCSIGSLLGVFISPFLILYYLGIHGSMNPITIIIQLSSRVLLPVLIGQLLQRSILIETYIIKKYKSIFRYIQQYCLIFIVYTVFCHTFLPNTNTTKSNILSISDVIIMILCQIMFLLIVMIIAWYVLGYLFPLQPKLRVMGFVGCSFKTIAVGVPLVNAMYANTSPELVAIYTLPLLIWSPMQLIFGSMLAPYLAHYVDTELDHIQQQQQQQQYSTHHNNYNTSTNGTTSNHHNKSSNYINVANETTSLLASQEKV